MLTGNSSLIQPEHGEYHTHGLNLPRGLGLIPLEGIKQLFFSDNVFHVNDVINALYPQYDDFDSGILVLNQKRILRIHKKTKKRKGILVRILRDRCKDPDSDFLRDFVWFATASKFIQRSTLKITVEFNYTESNDEHSLPVAHTCSNVLKLPALAYDGNREILEQKLDESILNVKGCPFNVQ